jgi:hypothetical protein
LPSPTVTPEKERFLRVVLPPSSMMALPFGGCSVATKLAWPPTPSIVRPFT